MKEHIDLNTNNDFFKHPGFMQAVRALQEQREDSLSSELLSELEVFTGEELDSSRPVSFTNTG